MSRLIGFSTGTIWRWLNSKNRNELIDYFIPFNLKAIELTIGSKEELDLLHLSEKNVNWLQKLDHVSIHAPALHTSASDENELRKQLQKLEDLVSLINAKTVVLHTNDIPRSHILETLQFPISIENTYIGNYSSPEHLESIFTSHPQFKFCLDLSHAALVSEKETEELVSRFGNIISHIHLSGIKGNRDHQSLSGASPRFYDSLTPALNLNIPFLIEEDIHQKDIELLYQEFNTAERLLKIN